MSANHGKILVAHGNTRKLRSAVDVLRDAGFEVIATPDGGDAFARFFEEEPDIVLCSAQLPGLSGVSFAAMVRSQAPATHVVVLIDPDEPASIDESTAGIPTINEPFDMASLRAALPDLPEYPPAPPADDKVGSATTSSVFALAALKRFQRDNSLLAVVDDQGLHRIASMACHEVRSDNERVLAEGDPGDGFYLVVEGQVRVTLAEKNDQEIARIGAGGFFGEMAMLSDRRRSASVWTVGPTTLLFFPREEFLPLLEAYPTMREVLSGVALKRTEENLWRSLFDDDDVQRSLGSLGAPDDDAPVPLPDMSDIGTDALAGEGAWTPSPGPAVNANASLSHQGRTPGNTTWHAYPGLDDGSYRQTPSTAPPPVVHTGIDEDDHHAAVRAAQSKGFIRGALTGAAIVALLAIAWIKMQEPKEWSPHDVAPPDTPMQTNGQSSKGKPTVEERKPITENRAPTVEEREPTTENRAPTVEEREPTTENQAPTAEERRPTTENRAPTIEERKPTTENQAPTVEEREPTTDDPAKTVTGSSPTAKTVTPPAPASTLLDSDRKRLRRDLMNALATGDNAKAVTAGLALETGNALDWEATYSLARAQQLTGDNAHALTRYAAFVATYPHNDYVDDAQFHSGEIYETRGRTKDAIAQYKIVASNAKSNLVDAAKARLAALGQ